MKRYRVDSCGYVEDEKLDEFIEAVIAVCRAHGLSISHQDGHGSFLLVDFNETCAEWLRDAHDSRRYIKP